jgi:hypothetical protein
MTLVVAADPDPLDGLTQVVVRFSFLGGAFNGGKKNESNTSRFRIPTMPRITP